MTPVCRPSIITSPTASHIVGASWQCTTPPTSFVCVPLAVAAVLLCFHIVAGMPYVCGGASRRQGVEFDPPSPHPRSGWVRPSGQAGLGAERELVSADFQVGGAYGGVGSRWRTTSWTCTRASLRRGAARLLLPTGPWIRLTGRAAPGFLGGSSPRACRRAAHVGRARETPTRNLLFSFPSY